MNTKDWIPCDNAPINKSVLCCYKNGDACFDAQLINYKQEGNHNLVWYSEELGIIEKPDYFMYYPDIPKQ